MQLIKKLRSYIKSELTENKIHQAVSNLEYGDELIFKTNNLVSAKVEHELCTNVVYKAVYDESMASFEWVQVTAIMFSPRRTTKAVAQIINRTEDEMKEVTHNG